MPSADCLTDTISDTPGLSAATQSTLRAPNLALAACVRCYLSRSTLGADLLPAQRLNHFPASLYVTLHWHLVGTTDLAWLGGEERVPHGLVSMHFAGPRTVPFCSRNPGPVRTFSVAMMPDAVQAMTGLDMSAQVNQVRPFDHVLDRDWQAMARAVMDAADDDARIAIFEQFLLPRAEAGFIQGQAERARDPEARFADLAALTGYADQAHLSRITRKVTGLCPTELMKAINQEESFWSYRLF